MPDRIDDAHLNGIRGAIAECPVVAAAYLFGSVARGDASENSDLDVAVLLRAEAHATAASALADLTLRLERFSPNGRVDLLVLGDQSPILRHAILREGILVADADPEVRFDYEGRTIVDYLDWKPTHDIAMEGVFEGLRARFARGAA